MQNLKIDYEPIERAAILSSDSPDVSWSQIRRVCEEHSDQVDILSQSSLSLPWWAFLSCRDEIAYFVDRYDLTLKVNKRTTLMLEAAIDKESSYEQARTSSSLSKTELRGKLSKLGFERKLTNEQLRNVGKLAVLDAAATFSVPGAGKTTEALASYFLKKTAKTRLLVIAPKNAFAAWEVELVGCVPKSRMKFVRLIGGEKSIRTALKKNPKLMLITYQQLQHVRELVASHLAKIDVFIFVDESHRIKRGKGGKIGAMILSLSHIPSFKIVMSGTPLPNSIIDLIPQFSFLYPEIEANADNVSELIQPIYVRTTKSELKLPPLSREIFEVSMSPAQWRLYRLLTEEQVRLAENILNSGDRIQLRALGKSVLRLLQLTSNPSLLAKSSSINPDLLADVLAEGDSPKLEYVCDRARELTSEGKKVVIWSSFVGNVELISSRLRDIGADYIHGGVDAGSDLEEDTREGKIRRFHDDKSAMVLVANPAACGEGISLHKVCHHAIYLDRNYNAAQYLQSEDRIHRLGLKKNQLTSVEILCCTDSVDISVDDRLRKKVAKMAEVLNDEGLHIDPVSFDPEVIDNNEEMDFDDAQSFVEHLKSVAV